MIHKLSKAKSIQFDELFSHYNLLKNRQIARNAKTSQLGEIFSNYDFAKKKSSN